MIKKALSKSVMERLPVYLHYLNSASSGDSEYISSTKIATDLNYGEVQVRKDLASVSGTGKTKVVYVKEELKKHLQAVLGTTNHTKVVIVGAGKLGRALMSFDGFEEYGYRIVAAFDQDDNKVDNQKILPLRTIKEYCLKNNILIGIITVPEKAAQEICQLIIDSGIKGIWNFSQLKLNVPEDVVVKNENMAASLAVLSSKINL